MGGWPAELLFDNMAQVRQRSGGLHPLFADFATHYGIAVKTHRVRRPRTKGKVERQVHYVKDNFLNGRAFADLDDLNAQARHWLDHTANSRVHATTGQRPIDLLAAESLAPIAAARPYRIYAPESRTVDWEGFVRFSRSRDSVPPRFAGSRVLVGLREQRVVIHAGGDLIAEHPAAQRSGQCVATEEHVREMWRLSVASKPLADLAKANWRADGLPKVEVRTLASYDEVAS